MRRLFRELCLDSPGVTAIRRLRLLVGLGALAVLLLICGIAGLVHPSVADHSSEDAAIGRIEGFGAGDTVRGSIQP